VESGLGEAIGDEFLSDSPLAFERYRGVPLIALIRMRWDLVTYQWARFVLEYDTERQATLLTRLLGGLSPARLVAAMLAAGGLAMLLVVLSLFGARPRRQREPHTVAYLRMCARLARTGLPRAPGEGPIAYAARVATARPELAAAVQGITDDFVALGYASSTQQGLLARLRRATRRFRASAWLSGNLSSGTLRS
jgi:hypothetical protein